MGALKKPGWKMRASTMPRVRKGYGINAAPEAEESCTNDAPGDADSCTHDAPGEKGQCIVDAPGEEES